MPLEHVRYFENGEWRPITAAEADRLYDHTVSVDSRAFICYSCRHYVTFKKEFQRSGFLVTSHFAHSRGDEEKLCEERTSCSFDERQSYLRSTISPPLLLRIVNNSIRISIGLLPVSEEELIKAERSHAEVIIRAKRDQIVKRFDASFFYPHRTTWLPVPEEPSDQYSIDVIPSQCRPLSWDKTIHLSTDGELFDKESGKRIPPYGDVTIGCTYYLLKKGWMFNCHAKGIYCKTLVSSPSSMWKLYEVRAEQETEEASRFFLEFHMLLTSRPTELALIWPPMREISHLIDTNHTTAWFVHKGDADVEGYPNGKSAVSSVLRIPPQTSLLRIANIARGTQMVWAAKSTVLRYIYLRPLEKEKSLSHPGITVYDDDQNELPDFLDTPPRDGNILINSDVDGKAIVSDESGPLYWMEIKANTTARIQEKRFGIQIKIQQGIETVRTITIAKQKENVAKDKLAKVVQWRGTFVPFDSRYAWITKQFPPDSEIAQRIRKALSMGQIESDGMQWVRKYMEENHHG